MIPAKQALSFQNEGFKVVFFLEGGLEMELPDGRTVTLEEGDAFSLSMPGKQIYRGLRETRQTRIHALRLDFDWPLDSKDGKKPRLTGTSPEMRFRKAIFTGLRGFRHFPRAVFPEQHRLIRQVLRAMEHPEESAQWRAGALCQVLLAGLLGSEKTGVETPVYGLFKKRGPAAVEHVRQYIEQNCHEALTLSLIAWQVQLSGEHLARLFRQQTGKTVFGYLDEMRAEKARRLLLTTELPLEQVAHSCGYSSSSLLSRHFKKQTGLPPQKFRLHGRTKESFWRSTLSPLDVEEPDGRKKREKRIVPTAKAVLTRTDERRR